MGVASVRAAGVPRQGTAAAEFWISAGLQHPYCVRTVNNVIVALQHPGRLAALRRTALLDSPTEEAFDRLTRLAVQIFGVPVALVSLVEADRQFFKSCIGLPEPWASSRGTPLSHSFCQHAVAASEPLVIEDARAHPLVSENLAIQDLGVVAYLGIPLLAGGQRLGTLCVIDHEPRIWKKEEIDLIKDLAAAVVTEIKLRTA